MATMIAYRPVDMLDYGMQYGRVVYANSSQLTLTDGRLTVVYSGKNFTYVNGNITGGVLNNLAVFNTATNTNLFEFSNFSISATRISSDIERGTPFSAVNEILSGDDNIYGSLGKDTLHGYQGNDRFYPSYGVNFIWGGDGLDTVILPGPFSEYIASNENSFFMVAVKDATWGNGFIGVERVQFENGTLALDISGNAGKAYRVYEAAFDRKPDAAGLSYWIKAMDRGSSLTNVANGFVGSAEFASIYGARPTNTDFVAKLYQNVLNRPGEGAGMTYWVGELDKGVSKAQVLASFAESPENVTNVSGAISDGIWLL